MVFNAPSFSEAGLVLFFTSLHFVLESSFGLMAFLLALAGFAVMAKVCGDSVGPAVGYFIASVVGTLGDEWFGILGAASEGFEICHHCFEQIFDVIGG